ncbi:hypothetical protein QBC47DRAFT_398027 [Echria macrotheca]|uniref:Uncharacterized protein n=1 Tax=Echria macrotheca TaxID=438768 RepID=A0AAJ0BJQ1_9PEZI|nr:hypothetical protein QBC47DRAFT_398027 [Echria macrotheca]
MKFSTATALFAMVFSHSAMAAPAEDAAAAGGATLSKRANWSFTPYSGNTCGGAGNAYVGTGSRGCTNINTANAVIAITDTCRITAYVVAGCPGGVGTVYQRGTSQCFAGVPGYKSFKVDC